MWFIIIIIYREVYFLYVITCCGEIVTPSAVFINHLLSTAMAMSNKWKAVVYFLLGNSPSSEFYILTFRNTVSVPSS